MGVFLSLHNHLQVLLSSVSELAIKIRIIDSKLAIKC